MYSHFNNISYTRNRNNRQKLGLVRYYTCLQDISKMYNIFESNISELYILQLSFLSQSKLYFPNFYRSTLNNSDCTKNLAQFCVQQKIVWNIVWQWQRSSKHNLPDIPHIPVQTLLDTRPTQIKNDERWTAQNHTIFCARSCFKWGHVIQIVS